MARHQFPRGGHRVHLLLLAMIAAAVASGPAAADDRRPGEQVLFAFDDQSFAWQHNLKLTLVQPDKYPANPVVRVTFNGKTAELPASGVPLGIPNPVDVDAVDELRKQEVRRLKKELPKDASDELKHTLWPFRKRSTALDESEQRTNEGNSIMARRILDMVERERWIETRLVGTNAVRNGNRN